MEQTELFPIEQSKVVTLRDDWPPDFIEIFWRRYPRRVGKQAAIKKLTIIRKSKTVTFARMIAAVDAYARVCATVETCFIKHPTTWLNAGCWDDEYEREQSNAKANRSIISAADRSIERLEQSIRDEEAALAGGEMREGSVPCLSQKRLR